MRILMMYEYPSPPAGLATQGALLYRGLQEIGVECAPVHLAGDLEKQWLYRCFKPDVAIGVGYWGQLPELVLHPRKFGVEPIPWLVADGWVANYQDELNSLRLILTTSGWVKEAYVRDGVSPDRMVVQPIGCDTESFKPIPRNDPKVRAVRESLGVADDEKLILTIGGDGASKGSREMMMALAKINKQYSNWRYVCKVWKQGRTDRQNRLDMALAEELGIRDKVEYVDGVLSREYMPYLYNACDIYAGPSRLEGFGMPHVEAQACGKPVLSVDAMGIKETVVHGKTGFLARVARWISLTECEVGPAQGYSEEFEVRFDEPKVVALRADVDDLVDYGLQLLTDDNLALRMGATARLHVLECFHYRQMAENVVRLINERIMTHAAVSAGG
ncbi:MAG: glycosyltransferase family 4 protein [Armatimonadetes bacterium]|nr:glycosyltransferase family 4 protein [Armatimonadota bacterium]